MVTSATLDITPSGNSNPVANDDIAATAEDTALVIAVGTLLANDSDVDGDPLTVIGVQAAVNGTVSLAAGIITFTPTANYFGPASFTYTISDGNGGTATATVNITVTAVNDTPNTTPVTLAPVAEDSSPRLITQAELLANATDIEGGALTASGLAISAGAGTLVDNGDGTWTYTPAANDDTTVNFIYTISDGTGAVAGSASLDLTPVNDAPVLVDNTFQIADGGTLVLDSANLSATDVDDPAIGLAFTVGGVTHGRFELIGAPGVPIMTFTQAEILAGQVRFVHDGSGIAPAFTLEVSDGAAIGGPYPGNVVFNAGGGGGGGNALGNAVGSGAVAATQLANSQTAYDSGLALWARPDVLPDPLLPLVMGVAQVYVRTPTGPVVTTATEETGGPSVTLPVPVTEGAPTPAEQSSSDAPSAGPAVKATLESDSIDAKPDELPTTPTTDVAELDPVRAKMDSIQTRQGSIAPTARAERTVLPGSLWIAGVIASLGAIAWVSRATGLVKKRRAQRSPWGRPGIPVVARDDEERRDASAIVAPPHSKEASPDRLGGTSAEHRE